MMLLGSPAGAAPAKTAEPLVLPRPQEMTLTGKRIPLVRGGKPVAVLVVEGSSERARFAARWLGDAVQSASGAILPVRETLPAAGGAIRFCAPRGAAAQALARRFRLNFSHSPDPGQAYAVVPEAGGQRLSVVAPSDQGLVYAAYTLAQLLVGREGSCSLREARIFDYPAVPVRGLLWIRGDDAYRHRYSQWAANWKLNCYTWYVTWNQPLSAAYREILRDCAIRGMTLVPTISWFQNTELRYSRPEYVEPMLARVREALEAGAGAFGFNFDDNPLRLFGEDEQAYPSLIAAQADLMQRVHAITAPAGADIFFCPTVYWKPYGGAQGNSLAAQYDYVRGMGRLFPKTVKPFTTTLSREWADEYQREVRRKPVFWHNFFPNDMADWKLYFEPYPRFPKELVARSDGAFVLGGWQTEWWKVNYLTFACNTWNPSRPCTLSDAFRKLWPAEAAALTRCALLLGGHDQPAPTIEGWPDHPHQQLRTEGFFNEPPTPENLKRLEEKEQRAAEAETLALGIEQRGRLPKEMARELVVAARRMKRNYQMALAAARVRQMEESGERGRLMSAETLALIDEALAAGAELERLVDSVGWPKGQASDLALQSYFTSLRQRVASGQGATPRLTAVRCTEPPHLDGQLDEPAWQRAPRTTPFYVIEGTPQPATQQTEARVLFDDTSLYLAFVCHEDQMDRLKTEFTGRDQAVWEDDALEIFIDPLRDRKNYFHLVASASGVQFDERVEDGRKDVDWNGEWQVATARAADGWTAEIAIPFRTLGMAAPTATQRIGLNLAREEVPHGEVSAWAITFGSFHQPGMFGDLAFGEEKEVIWIEAESVARTNFLYGVQLATAREEARGTYGTGYLNLNVAHPGGPAGDPPDGSDSWVAEWHFECPQAGEYALWVLGSDEVSGQASWRLDEGAEYPERRAAKVPVAPGYARPLELGHWHRVALGGDTVKLTEGKHRLTLRVRAEDPALSKRCGYFIDSLVLAPPGWQP